MQGIHQFLSHVCHQKPLFNGFPDLSKRSHFISTFCIGIIIGMVLMRIFDRICNFVEDKKNNKQPYSAVKIANGKEIMSFMNLPKEDIGEIRKHEGESLKLEITKTCESVLALEILPIKYDLSSTTVNPTTWVGYGFHCLTDKKYITAFIEKKWQHLEKNYFYKGSYLFHSCGELTFLESSFSDIRFYYQGENILQHLPDLQKQVLLTKMMTRWSPAQDKFNCLSFFNDVFDATSGTCFFESEWEKYILPDHYLPKSPSPLIFYQDSGNITHWAIYLSQGITISKLGTTGRIMFMSITDLKALYESPHVALILKKSSNQEPFSIVSSNTTNLQTNYLQTLALEKN